MIWTMDGLKGKDMDKAGEGRRLTDNGVKKRKENELDTDELIIQRFILERRR